MSVKIVAYIDSVDDLGDGAASKTLTGFISENVGDNSVNVYEVTYDRAAKKIIAVKPTGETSDIEQDDNSGNKGAKKTTAKKSKSDDDDDDDDADKPAKTKSKKENEDN